MPIVRISRASGALLAGLLATALGLPAAAEAAMVVVTPADPPRGSLVTARGSGFAPRGRVAVRLAGQRVSWPVADRAGRFYIRVRLPSGAVGPRTLLSRAGPRRVINVLEPGHGALAELATSAGVRVRIEAGPVPAGGALRIRARGLSRRGSVWARLGDGQAVMVRADAARRAAGVVPVPSREGRQAMVVRAGGATARLAVLVTPARGSLDGPAPGGVGGPTPAGDAGPAPTPGVAPRLAAVGDVACASGAAVTTTTCRHASTAALAAGLAPTAVALLGDTQYETGALADFQGSFAPTWGAALGARLHPAPGNHEYGTPGASGYFTYFGSAAGETGRGWYSYDLGSWHLVALNTNDACTDVPCGSGSEQQGWLRDDLAAHPAACSLVYWHHPRFSSGPHGNTTAVDALWRTARAGGVDVALAGHDHLYERFAPQDADGQASAAGTREFVVGTGGKSLYPVSGVKPNSEVRIADTFGVLELELRNGSYGWRFLSEGGAVRDQGSDDCA